ncbi:protein-L-isoaspartate O-methyltransferase family protein [Mucilaginibacter antarcticus]|uniref:protein-L-isoaspartate O-methyltransferase family protein n=1 Tax=Mucilaginibacter antarcticus TaxID=1855725 RepID=UPI00363100C6
MLHIKKGDKVLEIGTGCGYQTCVLMEVGAKVYSIERQEKLYERTRLLLPRMGYKANFFRRWLKRYCQPCTL